jgi:hypothetical protein
MSGTLQATVLKDGASSTNNITLDASGNATIGNNLTVTGTTTLTGAFTSAVTAPSFIPTGTTVPANGMYLSAANTLNLATNTTNQVSISSTGIVTGTAGNLMLVQGTSQNLTSGTSAPFTNIPSWVKRITISISNLTSASAQTSVNIIQLGTGATPTYTTTGYLGTAGQFASATPNTAAYTTGFGLSASNASNLIKSGIATLTLVDAATNTWAFTFTGSMSTGATLALAAGGYIALAGALTAVQLTTVNGTDTFATGKVNIQYE